MTWRFRSWVYDQQKCILTLTKDPTDCSQALAVAAPAGQFPGPSAVDGTYHAVPYAAVSVKKLQLEKNLQHGAGRSREQHVPHWPACGQRHTPVWLPSGLGSAWKRPSPVCVLGGLGSC